MASITFQDLRAKAALYLKAASVNDAAFDIRILLMAAGGFSRADLISNVHEEVPSSIEDKFNALLARRAAKEPIAYIIGEKEFWSLIFKVTPDVLIPRPETEGVVVQALGLVETIKSPRILDVGIGSGALLISILHERKDAIGVGVDISIEALQIAAQNAERLGVIQRCEFVQSNFLKKIEGRFDLVVSNPPYIDGAAMMALPPDVKHYEPALALSGGNDGLEGYRAILKDAKSALKPNANIIFEIGFDQADSVTTLLRDFGFENINIFSDLAGHDRVLSAKISNNA